MKKPRVGGIDTGHERAYPDYAAARHCRVLWDAGGV